MMIEHTFAIWFVIRRIIDSVIYFIYLRVQSHICILEMEWNRCVKEGEAKIKLKRKRRTQCFDVSKSVVKTFADACTLVSLRSNFFFRNLYSICSSFLRSYFFFKFWHFSPPSARISPITFSLNKFVYFYFVLFLHVVRLIVCLIIPLFYFCETELHEVSSLSPFLIDSKYRRKN